MNDDKIIQIIPAADMWEVCRGEDCGEKYESWLKIVCFALMECSVTHSRYVQPMSLYVDGTMGCVSDSPDFSGIAYANLEEARRRGFLNDESEEAAQ